MSYNSHTGSVCIKKCETLLASLSSRFEFVLARVNSNWHWLVGEHLFLTLIASILFKFSLTPYKSHFILTQCKSHFSLTPYKSNFSLTLYKSNFSLTLYKSHFSLTLYKSLYSNTIQIPFSQTWHNSLLVDPTNPFKPDTMQCPFSQTQYKSHLTWHYTNHF